MLMDEENYWIFRDCTPGDGEGAENSLPKLKSRSERKRSTYYRHNSMNTHFSNLFKGWKKYDVEVTDLLFLLLPVSL